MPFTPLHMGLGLTAKAAVPAQFSLLMFGLSQVAMDIQPLVAMTTGGAVELHGLSHTIIGATFIGLVCLPFRGLLGRLFKQTINSRASVIGTFVGVYSHLLLDAIVHPDVSGSLFYPARIESPLFGLLSWDGMTWLCGVLAALGMMGLWRRGELGSAFGKAR